MVLASTWMDLVLGVDIHILMIPVPPAPAPVPTPTPLPFTGIVLDPIGAGIGAAMGASTILINGVFSTNCGTAVYNVPWHPPVPPTIQGKADNDAELWFGALNVEIGGSLAVRLGEIALSCSDPVRMPTSVVLAIPKGPLVIIPRPPVPDLKVIAFSLAFKGLFAGLKWFRNFQKTSEFWEALSKKIKNAVPENSRLRNLWDKGVCFLTGHPVDVATGRLLTDHVDIELPGSLPLRFAREYSSARCSGSSSLGYGWAHNYDEALWVERGCSVYRTADGRELEFDTMDLPERQMSVGRSVYLERERLTLKAPDERHVTVTDATGLAKVFARVPGGDPGELRLIAIRNRLGEQQQLSYDDRGQLLAVYDPAGRHLRFIHDGQGRLVQLTVTGSDGVEQLAASYGYSPAGDLSEARDALGQAYKYDYFNHLMVKETNKNGLSFFFQYDHVDERAKCVRTWGDGGIYDHVITYSPDGRTTTVENSRGSVTVYEMNEVGQVVKVIDPLGRATAYEYDQLSGQKLKETAADGAETVHEYDERGNLIRLVQADGSEVVLQYNAANQPVQAADALGGVWQWGYDEHQRLVVRRDPLERTTQFQWSEAKVVAFADEAGQWTRFAYDSRGNLAALTNPDGTGEAWGADGLGRIVSRQDANGNVQTLQRDLLGRAVVVQEPDGNQRSLNYDPEGNVTRAVDRQYDVAFEYSGMNRLAARSQAGTRIEFRYNSEEDLVGIKNEHGLVYRFGLDPAGDVSEEYGFDELRRRYVRDAAGRVSLTARPEGRTTAYAYDKLGRVLSVTHSDGTKEEFEYRQDGEMIAANNGGAELSFERDAVGRVIREIQGDDWVASAYGPQGLRTQITSSKGLYQRIERNAMGDVLAVAATVGEAGSPSRVGASGQSGSQAPTSYASGPASFSAAFQRDRLGLEIERSLPGGVRAQWHRDRLGRPLRHEVFSGGRAVLGKQYMWDTNDRLKRVIDAMHGPVHYHHDEFGNLAAAVHADGRTELRMPDAVGNLFRTQDRSDRKYGPAGQLLEAHDARGTTRYQYDPEGNLSRKLEPNGGEWRYEWSGTGMLSRVIRPDGKTVEFVYDALGRRVSKTYRGKRTRWIWDGNVPLHEWVERDASYVEPEPEEAPAQTEAASSIAAEFRKAVLTQQPAQGPPPAEELDESQLGTPEAPITWLFEPESFAPLGKLVGGEHYGIVTDHLGTPTSMYDGAGQEVWGADIDTYGDLSNQRGARQACPFRWPGQYEDAETGLYYNRFRYYDCEAGEYVSQDPIRDVGGLRLITYVMTSGFSHTSLGDLYQAGSSVFRYPGDPLTWVDPTGRVRILTENGVEFNAYPGPPAGGIEHLPLHAHVEEAGKETRVLMEDYVKKGELVGAMGEVYPGDPSLSKKARRVIRRKLDELAEKARSVFNTGSC